MELPLLGIHLKKNSLVFWIVRVANIYRRRLTQSRQGAKEDKHDRERSREVYCECCLGLLINFGASLIKDGIHRIANGLPD